MKTFDVAKLFKRIIPIHRSFRSINIGIAEDWQATAVEIMDEEGNLLVHASDGVTLRSSWGTPAVMIGDVLVPCYNQSWFDRIFSD